MLLVVQIELQGILVFLFIDILRKVQNLKNNESELLEERVGLLKQVACVVNTSPSLALFRERQITDFIKIQYHLYFHSFPLTKT